jgi:adenylylsulfate kinase-like enzyme
VSDPYEAPINPEIEIRTDELSAGESVQKIVEYLKKNSIYNLSS